MGRNVFSLLATIQLSTPELTYEMNTVYQNTMLWLAKEGHIQTSGKPFPPKPKCDRRKKQRPVWITSMDFREQPGSLPSVLWRRRQTQKALSEVCLNQNSLQLSPMVWTLPSELAHFKYPLASCFTIEECTLRDFFEDREEKLRAHWDPHLYRLPQLFVIYWTCSLHYLEKNILSIYSTYNASSEGNVNKANKQTREEMTNLGRLLTILWLYSICQMNLGISSVG